MQERRISCGLVADSSRSPSSSRKTSSGGLDDIARRWSRQHHAKVFFHCEHLRTLRRVIVLVAGMFDKGRLAEFEREHALLCQIFGAPGQRERTVDTTGHGCGRCWGSGAVPDVHRPPAEACVVISWHTAGSCDETAGIGCAEQAPEAESDAPTSEDDSVSETHPRSKREADAKQFQPPQGNATKATRRVGQLKATLDHAFFANLLLSTLARARFFRRDVTGHFFCVLSSFEIETDFTRFLHDAIANARGRHVVRQRQIPMHHRARCDRDDPRAGIQGPCHVLHRAAHFWMLGAFSFSVKAAICRLVHSR